MFKLILNSLLVICLVLIPNAFAKTNHHMSGKASWYGPGFQGKRTASGSVYNMYSMTAAHKTLPFGTKVKVTNLSNGKSVVVTITDRGPFVKGRVIDLSKTASKQLSCNLCKVKLTTVGKVPVKVKKRYHRKKRR